MKKEVVRNSLPMTALDFVLDLPLEYIITQRKTMYNDQTGQFLLKEGTVTGLENAYRFLAGDTEFGTSAQDVGTLFHEATHVWLDKNRATKRCEGVLGCGRWQVR